MDYAVKVSIRNGRILRKMRERGFETQTALAQAAGVSMQTLNAIVGLRQAPRGKRGEWREGVENIAAALRCDPEDLFSDTQQFLALPRNSHEVYMDEDRVAALAGGDMEQTAWAKLEAQRLLSVVTNPRHRQAVEAVMNGATLDEAGAEVGASRERVRQMVEKSIRRMRHAAKVGQSEYKSIVLRDMVKGEQQ